MNRLITWSLVVSGVLAHSTVVYLHCSRMWEAQHFQFFPIAFVAAAALAISLKNRIFENELIPQRHETSMLPITVDIENQVAQSPPNKKVRPVDEPGAPVVVALLMSLDLLLLFVAIVLNFALTGWYALLLFIATLIYGAHGWRGLRIMFPVFAVLLIIKPLPGFAEQSITIGMQRIASEFASRILDMIGIVHFQQGVILQLVTKSFMAEDACSGIRSLFSSITAIVVWGLFHRYSIVRHGFNILQTIVWVVVCNALRIAIVIAVEDRTDFSLATGLAHDMLGLLIFFLIFGLVLSTDQFYGFLFQRDHDDADINKADYPNCSWTYLFRWSQTKPWAYLLTSLYLLLFIFSLRLLFLVPDYKDTFAAGDLPASSQGDLPSPLGIWNVQHFEHVHREQGYLQGRDSYIWTLRNLDRQVLISIDGTFGEFHDLEWCYSALGWGVNSIRNYSPLSDVVQGKNDPTSEFSKVQLSKLSGETGIVLFTGLDKYGKVVVPPPLLNRETSIFILERFSNAIRFALGMSPSDGMRSTTFSPPVSNIQLVYYPSSKLTEEETEELVSLFLDAREILRSSERFRSGK